MKTLRKSAWYPHPIADVWIALTDPNALAEWLMPNNFKPEVGATFRFHVDPMPGYSGITECKVLEVEPPHRLVYTWLPLRKVSDAVPPPPMTLIWTLAEERNGTALSLEQRGVDILNWWWRFSMSIGWNRMLKTLLPKVIANVEGGAFRPGAIRKRDYGTKTVPSDYAK